MATSTPETQTQTQTNNLPESLKTKKTLDLTTCLWFANNEAQAAAEFYVSVFPNSRITHVQRYTEAGREHHGQEPGSVLIVEFVLGGDGHRYVALNGGGSFKLSPAFSTQIDWLVSFYLFIFLISIACHVYFYFFLVF